MRCILLVLDGLGDKGIKELGGLTPLQAAHTPNLDAISAAGANGMYHSTLQGIAMPSEMAHFSIFGYDMNQFPGRGIIEAVGEGLPLDEDDVAILARTFSVREEDESFILHKEKLELDREECLLLQESISRYSFNGIDFSFHPTGGIGGILLLKGKASHEITDSNPIFEGRPIMKVLPREDAENRELAQKTADAVNSYTLWSFHTLSRHPVNISRQKKGLPAVNIVGLQRSGKLGQIIPFEEKWGLRSLCIASGAIYHGLCSILGMKIIKAKDSGNACEDLLERLKLAKGSEDHDFIYVHSKAPDEAAHKRDPLLKQRTIADLDKAFKFVLEEIIPDEKILFIVTSDHSTASVGTMIHSGETVPIVMKGKYTRKDSVSAFDEVSCSGGCLGQLRGKEIMYMILNLMDRGKLAGLMDSPSDQPYSPGRYTSLRRNLYED